MSEYKIPKKSAVEKLRELYEEKRSRKRSPEVLEEMKEMFKKKQPSSDQKKIARSNNDLEST